MITEQTADRAQERTPDRQPEFRLKPVFNVMEFQSVICVQMNDAMTDLLSDIIEDYGQDSPLTPEMSALLTALDNDRPSRNDWFNVMLFNGVAFLSLSQSMADDLAHVIRSLDGGGPDNELELEARALAVALTHPVQPRKQSVALQTIRELAQTQRLDDFTLQSIKAAANFTAPPSLREFTQSDRPRYRRRSSAY